MSTKPKEERLVLRLLHDADEIEESAGTFMRDVASHIREAVALIRPIPVEERLPEKGTIVSVWHNGDWRQAVLLEEKWEKWEFYDMNGWDGWDPEDKYCALSEVTHWLPLPPNPE